MIIKYLIHKEFLQIKRNSFIPRLIIMFPIMVLCVMPWAMNFEVKNIKVDIVDNDRSSLSRQLIDRFKASQYFLFNAQPPTSHDALRDIESSQADLIVNIPHDFEADIRNGRSPHLLISANAVNGTKASMASAYASQIVTSHISPDTDALQNLVSTLYLYNRNLDYKLFMIPSLMAIVIMLICGFLPALNIVSEKEKGTIEAINVTPVSKLNFIMAKLIPYWLIGLIVISICFTLAWLIYDMTPAGNILLLYLPVLLLSLIFSGLGLVVSNNNSTMQQAIFVMWFIIMCLMLLSGLFTPVRSMPQWAYLTTYVNPMHYFIDAIRTVYIKGGGLSAIYHQILALSLFALVMNVWAVRSYKKNG